MMSVKVAVYDVSEGWTNLLDYFHLNVSESSVGVNSSFFGARAAYSTMYVTNCTTLRKFFPTGMCLFPHLKQCSLVRDWKYPIAALYNFDVVHSAKT